MDKKDFTGLEIAIVGYSGRFADCRSMEDFWQQLAEGHSSIHDFSSSELEALGLSSDTYENPNYVRSNGILDQKDCFDAEFWGYTPAEAAVMDPQMRIFHECVWEAMEMAGYAPDNTKGKVGVFGYASNNAHWQTLLALKGSGTLDPVTVQYFSNVELICSRVAYRLNLKGPAVFVSTACSSALVAIHQACRALLTGDCDMALAGGVCASLLKQGGYMHTEGYIFSGDGKCRPFDHLANGTVSGEGGGMVTLKRYSQAIKDGDHIHGIIRGSAINNDGNDKIAYTAPSVKGQVDVIKKAMSMARVSENSISYIESHGTGTKLGDAIELKALDQCFGATTGKTTYVGAVKSNIGHLDGAAGIAGLLKVLLMFKHRKIPATAHFQSLNPEMKKVANHLLVNSEVMNWERNGTPLRAGISSFGIGGTNAHIILQEPEMKVVSTPKEQDPQVLVLSAKTPEKLEQVRSILADHLLQNEELNLTDTSFTLFNRSPFAYRTSLVSPDIQSLIAQLKSKEQRIYRVGKNGKEPVAFVFGGQGTQYHRITEGLYHAVPAFRTLVDECFQICAKEFDIDMQGIVFSEANPDLHETLYTQLSLFTIQYSYARLLIGLGVKPYALIGHSIGEYVAAAISGIYTLKDALAIVHQRGRLMQENCKGGGMCAVFTDKNELSDVLPETLEIGAENGLEFQVVTGPKKEIEQWSAAMQEKGLTTKILEVQYAFHSRSMETILPDFQEFLKAIPIAPAKIPIISNLTGDFAEKPDADYWCKHMRQPVLFVKGMETLLKSGYQTYVDFGFGNQMIGTLEGLRTNEKDIRVIEAIRHRKKNISDHEVFLKLIGDLWTTGYEINRERLFENHSPKRIALPTYPFERISFPAPFNIKSVIQGKLEFGVESNDSDEQWVYRPHWVQNASVSGKEHTPTNTLVICDNREALAPQIQSTIDQAGDVVYLVPADRQDKIEDDCFTFRLHAQESDLDRIMTVLATGGYIPDTIIHALGLENPEISAPESLLQRGYLNLAFLLRTVHNHLDVSQLHLAVLGQELHQVVEKDTIDPLKSCVTGALKVMSVEYDYLHCKVVDLGEFHSTEPEWEGLQNELRRWEKFSSVAIREGQRLSPAIKRIESDSTVEEISLKKDGCVVVVGGTGGMGFSVGTDLAENEGVEVVLIHRSAFPQKKDWENVMPDDSGDEFQKATISKLKKLTTAGAKIHLYQADVSQSDQIKEVFDKINIEVGSIQGIVWAAGVIDEAGVLQKRAPESLISAIESKVHGLIHLEQTLDFNSLNFLMLFSSMGNINYHNKGGQIGYNVANEFLEAFAYYAKSKYTCKTSTINWIDWTDVGMSVRALKSRFTNLSIDEINEKIEDALTPAEGVSVFKFCLAQSASVFYLSKGDLSAGETKMEQVPVTFKRPEVSTPFSQPETGLEQQIADILTATFGIDKVGRDDDFFELGGDSLKAIQVTNYLKKSFETRISLEQFYAHPTIAELAKLLTPMETLPGQQTEVEEVTGNAIERYPALPPQRQIYVASRMFPGATNYNQPFIYKVSKPDTSRLAEALRTLTERHQALRTSFKSEGTDLFLEIADQVGIEVKEFMIRDDQDLLKDFVTPFDLGEAPLFRVAVVNSEDGKAYLLIDLHHIISDGVSNLVFLNELLTLYNAQALPAKGKDLLDYVEHIYGDEARLNYQELEDYWLERFREVPAKPLLPGTRGTGNSFEGESIDFELEGTLEQNIRSLCRKEGLTTFVFYLAAFNILLHKLSGSQDITVGTTLTGRDEAGFEDTMGMFVQTLALRNEVEPDALFPDLLKKVKEQTIRDFDHRSYPFEDLLAKLEVFRHDESNPLFDIVFAGENLVINNLEASGNEQVAELDFSGAKEVVFDLLFSFFESDTNTVFSLEFKKSRFNAGFIRQLFKYFERVLKQVVESDQFTQAKVSEIHLLEEAEVKEVIDLSHAKSARYRSEQTIGESFSAIASSSAEATAVVSEDTEMSYATLDTRCNELAHFLLENCALKASDRVAVMLDRTPSMLVSILGIIKAGGVFVPIAPEYPWARKEYMLANSETKVLLTDSVHMFSMEGGYDGQIVAMDIQEEEIQTYSSSEVSISVSPSDLAYMIYTSGSTGKPKGVMIEHRSLLNYVDWALRTYVRNEPAVFPLHTNISFDLTLTSVFVPLLSGNKLKIYKGDSQEFVLSKILEEGECNIIKLTPSHLRALRSQGLENVAVKEGIRLIIGGEELDRQLAETIYKHYAGNIEIYNEYGPTEATVGCMAHLYDPSEQLSTIPIGKPMDNTGIYLLDEQLKPVVPGTSGEIYISGDCLARGYMNKPELTADRFVEDPYFEGRRMYQTGDLGCWLSDGTMLYQGRKDEQVKIRGYRIELSEVSATLTMHKEIEEAVVIQSGDRDNAYLVAYYIATKELEISELRDLLSRQLPDYMLPSYFKRIDAIPLTTNGKLNKAALPEYSSVSEDIIKPEGELEEQLLEIWSKTLNVEQESLSVTSRFFHIGGDSLRALTIIRQIEQEVGVQISVRDFFESSTIRMVSKLIKDSEHPAHLTSTVPKVEKKEVYSASSAQERMLFEQLMDETSLKYNISKIYRLDDHVDTEMIGLVFQQLIQRHECFRTRVFIDDSGIVQQIAEEVSFQTKLLDSGRYSQISEAYDDFVRPFDLSVVPLLRCGLLELPNEARYLLVDTHHIVCDGISLNILMNEFMAFFKGEPLPDTGLKYVDYAHWQKSKMNGISPEGEFWTKQLAGGIPRINLPIQRERSLRSLEGGKKSFTISLNQVNEMAASADVSSYMLLLTLYYVVMNRFSGDTDIIVGTDGDGRGHSGFSHTVGTFINVLPLRLTIDPERTLHELLSRVKSTLLSALDNQGFPFDSMQNLVEEHGNVPIVDIYFSYTNFFDEGSKFLTGGFIPVHLSNGTSHARYELELNVIEDGEAYSFDLIYDRSLFDETMVDQFISYYHQLLVNVSERFDSQLCKLEFEVLSDAGQTLP